MSIIEVKPESERKPGPYAQDRHCPNCSAKLSRNNPGPHCGPCNGGDWGGGENELDARREEHAAMDKPVPQSEAPLAA